MFDASQLIKALWPLWVLLGVVFLVRIVFDALFPALIDRWRNRRRFAAGKKWRSDQELLWWLRSMKPARFEEYIAGLFSHLGYKTEAVGRSHDGGIDVIARKDGITNYIQCKKFITSEVTLGAVRDFYGALADHLANGQGYFITTNKFTLDAREFAKDKPIELIDGFELIRYIRMAEKQGMSSEQVSVGQNICPKCGGTLIERNGKFGSFYGCSNYPKCTYTVNKNIK